MPFTTDFTVRFGHVDAASIVFYPRYLEMLNEAVERWFEEGLGISFKELHVVLHRGAPTKRIAVDFLKPSRLGDKLTFTLSVAKVGGSSFDLRIDCACGGEVRFKAEATLVYASLEPFAATPIPDDMRRRMMAFADA